MELIYFLGLLSATWLFTTAAEPIYWLKSWLGIAEDDEPKDLVRIFLQRLTSCSLCMGFWFGLAYYQNLLFACSFAVCAEVFHRLANKYINKI